MFCTVAVLCGHHCHKHVFIISLKTLKEKLSVLAAESDGGVEEDERHDDEEKTGGESTLTGVKDSLNDVIDLCHRSSPNLNQQQREVVVGVCVCLCVGRSGGLSACLFMAFFPLTGPLVSTSGDHDEFSKTRERTWCQTHI